MAEKFENSGFDSSGRVVLRVPPEDANKYLAAPVMCEALEELVTCYFTRAYEDGIRVNKAWARAKEVLAAILEGVAEDAAEEEQDTPRRPVGT